MITLYGSELSADCYKVRLLLGILGVPYRTVPTDGAASSAPALDDDGYVPGDAPSMLVHLAAAYDTSGCWYPADDALVLHEVAAWIRFAGTLSGTAGAARVHDTLGPRGGHGAGADIDALRAAAHRLLRELDDHLWFAEREGRSWVAGTAHPTVADLALFADVMLSDQGGISLLDYPAVRRWTDRVKRVPGFTVMAGIYPASRARPVLGRSAG